MKPSEVNEVGYRFYGEDELILLQQILFYRERGLELEQIRHILYQDDFDVLYALKEHLLELEKQKRHIDGLIRIVEQTIRSMKAIRTMELKDTIAMMQSADYKERFRAEYYQIVIRYQKLKEMLKKWDNGELNFNPTCPRSTYNMQIAAMTDYIAVLEARAVMEGIEL